MSRVTSCKQLVMESRMVIDVLVEHLRLEWGRRCPQCHKCCPDVSAHPQAANDLFTIGPEASDDHLNGPTTPTKASLQRPHNRRPLDRPSLPHGCWPICCWALWELWSQPFGTEASTLSLALRASGYELLFLNRKHIRIYPLRTNSQCSEPTVHSGGLTYR